MPHRAQDRAGATRHPRAGIPPPGGTSPHPADLVDRGSWTARPNRLRVTDLPCIPTWSGMACVALVIGTFSRRVVGWRARAPATTDLVLDTSEHALWLCRQEGSGPGRVGPPHRCQFPARPFRPHPASGRSRRRRTGRLQSRPLRRRSDRIHDRAVQDRADPPRRPLGAPSSTPSSRPCVGSTSTTSSDPTRLWPTPRPCKPSACTTHPAKPTRPTSPSHQPSPHCVGRLRHRNGG